MAGFHVSVNGRFSAVHRGDAALLVISLTGWWYMSPYNPDEEEIYGPSEFAYYDDNTDEWVEPGDQDEDDPLDDVERDDRDDGS